MTASVPLQVSNKLQQPSSSAWKLTPNYAKITPHSAGLFACILLKIAINSTPMGLKWLLFQHLTQQNDLRPGCYH